MPDADQTLDEKFHPGLESGSRRRGRALRSLEVVAKPAGWFHGAGKRVDVLSMVSSEAGGKPDARRKAPPEARPRAEVLQRSSSELGSGADACSTASRGFDVSDGSGMGSSEL